MQIRGSDGKPSHLRRSMKANLVLTLALILTFSPAGTMQSDRSCLLDLFTQELRRSSLTDPRGICARLTPRLAQKSASQSLPSQLHRSGPGEGGRVDAAGLGEAARGSAVFGGATEHPETDSLALVSGTGELTIC